MKTKTATAFITTVTTAAKAAGHVRLFLDVEAAGLHSAGDKPVSFSYDAFVGGEHIASYVLACEEGTDYIRAESQEAQASGQFDFFGSNVLPKMGDMPTVKTCRELREEAWAVWSAINGAKDSRKAGEPWVVEATHYTLELWGDVVWPVEANFFSAMIADGEGGRDWDGPCPILDVASVLAALGHDAFGLSRFEAAGLDAALQHHPSYDNIASNAVLLKALNGTL